MTLELSALAVEALRGLNGFGGEQDSPGIERAIRAYLEPGDARRPSWQYPEFMRQAAPGERVGVELSVDAELWEMLEHEAMEQDVAPEALVDQAVFVFAAEVERGALKPAVEDAEPDEPGLQGS